MADQIDVEIFRNVPTMLDVSIAARNAPRGLKLEFGVFQGSSIRQIAEMGHQDETIWGFDTFTGTDDVWHKGPTTPVSMTKFDLHGDLPEVPSNVKLVQGLFQDTLPAWWEKHRAPIGLLNIDSDLYESAIFILCTLNDGIVPGTLVRFDELCDFRKVLDDDKRTSRYSRWREGEWRALNEWIEKLHRTVEAVGRNKQSGVVRVVV